MARLRRQRGLEMNLDSLTDIMANTVGIMVFVMIFAVLAARGTFVRKRLPVVHPSAKERQVFLCTQNTVRSYPMDRLIDQVCAPIKGKRLTYDNIPDIVARLNQMRVQEGDFEAVGQFHYTESQSLSYVLSWGVFQPEWRRRELDWGYVVIRPLGGGRGETVEELGSQEARFRLALAEMSRERHWVLFLVDADSLDVFQKARDVARGAGFESNWEPWRCQWPERIDLVGRRPEKGDAVADWWDRFGPQSH